MPRSLVDGVAIQRSYKIISSRGTTGTCHQRLLAFTIAGAKAPDRALRGFVASSRVVSRYFSRRS